MMDLGLLGSFGFEAAVGEVVVWTAGMTTRESTIEAAHFGFARTLPETGPR